jgi:hypothetical protein
MRSALCHELCFKQATSLLLVSIRLFATTLAPVSGECVRVEIPRRPARRVVDSKRRAIEAEAAPIKGSDFACDELFGCKEISACLAAKLLCWSRRHETRTAPWLERPTLQALFSTVQVALSAENDGAVGE